MFRLLILVVICSAFVACSTNRAQLEEDSSPALLPDLQISAKPLLGLQQDHVVLGRPYMLRFEIVNTGAGPTRSTWHLGIKGNGSMDIKIIKSLAPGGRLEQVVFLTLDETDVGQLQVELIADVHDEIGEEHEGNNVYTSAPLMVEATNTAGIDPLASNGIK